MNLDIIRDRLESLFFMILTNIIMSFLILVLLIISLSVRSHETTSDNSNKSLELNNKALELKIKNIELNNELLKLNKEIK